jgi:hypothetical protein
MKAVMNISTAGKLIFLALLTAILAGAPCAIADDINPDADVPDISSMSDPAPANPVLEIPQQCDQDSVAVLCDRSAEDNSSSAVNDAYAAAPAPDADDSSELANNPNVGSVYDYANQNITSEASAAGTMNVPMGGYAPGYAVLSPGPTIVSGQEYRGPGSYQQWAGGPGSYQQWAPGPGYIAPAPMGYHPYGLGGSFGGHAFFGGHFGHH